MKKAEHTFTERVLEIVKHISRGKVMTYGEVAKRAGRPGAARAVGNIMANNIDKRIPCHRVVRADGSIGGYNQLQGESKQTLLQKEGAI